MNCNSNSLYIGFGVLWSNVYLEYPQWVFFLSKPCLIICDLLKVIFKIQLAIAFIPQSVVVPSFIIIMRFTHKYRSHLSFNILTVTKWVFIFKFNTQILTLILCNTDIIATVICIDKKIII